MTIRGSVDTITANGATGWAYVSGDREPLMVQALILHEVIGEAMADLFRADLAEAGIGDGCYGYQIDFYRTIDPLLLPFIAVKPEGGDVELPRMSITGYSDFFRAFFEQWPITGRHHSVLGGLWTDRIDPAAVLRARCDLGWIAEHSVVAVEHLLQHGLAIVGIDPPPAHEHGPPEQQEDEVATSAIGHTLENPAVADILQATLEDRPLAIAPRLAGGEQAEMFHQPSGMQALTSPTECLALIVTTGDWTVDLEVVRDSHRLPEFTSVGVSRWTCQSGVAALHMAERFGLVDRYALAAGSAALIGPGLLYRVVAPAAAAARTAVIPSRAAPLALREKFVHERVYQTGARIWH